MEEKTTTIFAGIIILLGIMLIFHQLRNKGNSVEHASKVTAPAAEKGAKEPPKSHLVQLCGQVTTECTAMEEINSKKCTQESATELARKLRSPLSSPGCHTAEQELNKACPTGCVLDSTSIFVVPGTIEYDPMLANESDGSCIARAKLAAKISASCLPLQ